MDFDSLWIMIDGFGISVENLCWNFMNKMLSSTGGEGDEPAFCQYQDGQGGETRRGQGLHDFCTGRNYFS